MYDVDFVDTITTTTWKEAFPWTISILFYSLKFKQKQMIVSVSIKFPSNLISSPPELSQGTNLVSIVRIYKWSICYIYYRRLSLCLVFYFFYLIFCECFPSYAIILLYSCAYSVGIFLVMFPYSINSMNISWNCIITVLSFFCYYNKLYTYLF